LSIEDIILDHDRRGISKLRPYLPADFCDNAAALILDHPGTAIIVTGFYILRAHATETDGPPGAVVIGEALASLGYDVVYVTDRFTAPVLRTLLKEEVRLVEFPITDEVSSRSFAVALLEEVDPSVLISIERCGLNSSGSYLNMRGIDFSDYNAMTDFLFIDHPCSIGIGDGGNEIGMGNLASVIPTISTLVKEPSVTTTTSLVISSVSNWGGYGLVAAMSRRKGVNLLPSSEIESQLVKMAVGSGAVDGMSFKAEYKVDGFTLSENGEAITRLHSFLDSEALAP